MVIEEPIVNTAPTKVTDQKVPEGKIISGVPGVVGELSPNPAGSGYVKQVVVDSLSSVVSPEPNVLYIVGDKKYKYLSAPVLDPSTNEVLIPAGWNRVGARADSFSKEGERHDPKIDNEASRKPDGVVPPQVFNHPVAFNGGVTIKGKEIEDYIDSQGGVTQAELDAAVTELNGKIANVIKVGSQINLGTINVNEGDTNTADFYKELTEAEFNAIADGGLCILLFNTTCAIFPYVKAYVNRTVVNAIAYNNGATMVTRIKLTIDGTGPRTIVVSFEEAFADALAANTNVRPYGVIQFIKLG